MIGEKWLLIGHRGAGKTSFLEQCAHSFERAIDLDAEVAKRSKKSVSELFEKYGEKAFRELETKTLGKILDEEKSSKSVIIALGAGYDGSIWPRDYKCLWIRRETDNSPRFYFDRPAVGTSDAENFLANFIEREDRFQKWSDVAWTAEEGEGIPGVDCLPYPAGIFNAVDLEGAVHTLYPHFHRDLAAAVELRKKWNATFELRSDLWSRPIIEKVTRDFARNKFLVSVRNDEFAGFKGKFSDNVVVDWDLSLGPVPDKISVTYFSLHDFSAGLLEGLRRLEKKNKKGDISLKASPIVTDLRELETLFRWWEEDPARRNIFPRAKVTTAIPAWQWFRLYMKGRQKLNFVREASEGLRDQPTIAQWIRTGKFKNFAAVLGNPVVHSYSPVAHREFFRKREMSFFAIPLSREALTQSGFKFLQSLGAGAYAVTSPLKDHKVLREQSRAINENAEIFANTLALKEGTWFRANTDSMALKKVAGEATRWKIWGSGAIAKQFYGMIENAEMYSSSKNELVTTKGAMRGPYALLWTAGDEAAPPPAEWSPQKVYDLSYSEKSSARLYAIGKKLAYESGVEFFKTQAAAQQELW